MTGAATTDVRSPHASTALSRALADELRLASAMLAELARDLGSDVATLRRHMTSLQAIDQISQIQLIIADLLCGGEEPAKVDAIPLETMRRRLQCAIGTPR